MILQQTSPNQCFATDVVKIAKKDEETTAFLHLVDSKGTACTTQLPGETVTCELVSEMTGGPDVQF